MDFVNLAHPEDRVSFATAVQRGLGRGRGLYFPEVIEPLEDVQALLALPFVERSARLLTHLTGLEAATVESLVKQWEDQCRQLTALGIDRDQLLAQSLISPSCGVGSLSLAQARKVLELTREVSAHIRKER